MVFKDRAACCRCDCVLPFSTSALHPIQPGGCILYFEAAFLSSGRCRCFPPLRLVWVPLRAFALGFFLSRGRGTYSASASRVNSLRRLFFRFAPVCRRCDFAVSRAGGFYHHRVGSQLRSPTSYFVFHCFVRGFRRRCDVAFPSEGARLLPPPRSESTAFVDSPLPPTSASSPARFPPRRGARLLPPPR